MSPTKSEHNAKVKISNSTMSEKSFESIPKNIGKESQVCDVKVYFI